jgi:alpha-1,3-rhamnosyl/mannosyltransferase
LVNAGERRVQSQAIARELTTLGLVNFVQFLGRVADADLPALYGGATLLVYPSLRAGFGLPPLEAVACSAPVVCSNAALLPEVAGDAALTFDPDNVEAMPDAVRLVLSDGDLRDGLPLPACSALGSSTGSAAHARR